MVHNCVVEKALRFLFDKTDFNFFAEVTRDSHVKMVELTWKPYELVGILAPNRPIAANRYGQGLSK